VTWVKNNYKINDKFAVEISKAFIDSKKYTIEHSYKFFVWIQPPIIIIIGGGFTGKKVARVS
jgi:hypothetical protein